MQNDKITIGVDILDIIHKYICRERERERQQITDWPVLLFDSIINVQFCM